MVLYLKSKRNELALTVTTVNMKQYPREIKELTHSPPPILLTDDLALQEDKIEEYLKEEFPDPAMFVDIPLARQKIGDVFLKFNHFLAAAGDDATHRAEKNLVEELTKINNHLQSTGYRYLCGDDINLYDCELMPKLQHIRVASKWYRNFEFPGNLPALWGYMRNAYETEAFRESCPADQDIIANYRGKARTEGLKPVNSKEEALQQPTFSLSVPEHNSY
ncbi:PREDICTED: chloride intracellular channel protein 6-like [Priapulus caudatus]|uniref:Chloride intracellular channel protein 6-like n=1 Tax=Priapulus caudatus TaxID=37621 RepID=A0ABM1ESB2_PRICU|nr:PREDICTED: chloride intracellular channel protein 6-like [Priapulus caudatus]